MAHYRTEIRNALAALLSADDGVGNYPTVAGAKVFKSRVRPVTEADMPCLLVYCDSEKSAKHAAGNYLERRLRVTVEAAISGDETVEDAADDFAVQIEATIVADPQLGVLLDEDLVLISTATELRGNGRTVLAGVVMEFEAVYLTPLVSEEPGELPSQVFVSGNPTDAAYSEGTLQEPLVQPPASECEGGSCDLPDWGGEVSP